MTTEQETSVTLKGPNRDQGELISFAIKGDLTYRVIRHSETGDQALVVTMPEASAAKVGYSLVKEIEARQAAKTKTRVKDD